MSHNLQSGPVILLVILCHSYWFSQGEINYTEYLLLFVFIKIHIITAQSGLAILFFLCYSHVNTPSPEGRAKSLREIL